MLIETDYCVIGTGAGGGILAYLLAKNGFDVISIDQGPLISHDHFKNEESPEQRGNFGILPNSRFPPSNPDLLDQTLFSDHQNLSSVPNTGFQHRQLFAVGGLLNFWGGVALRFSEEDFANRSSAEAWWPISYADLMDHYSAVESLAPVCGEAHAIKQFPDGNFISPLPKRNVDHLLEKAVRKLGNPEIFTTTSRKAIETRKELKQVCRQCGLCITGCKSASIYSFPSRLLPKIENLTNYQLKTEIKAIRFQTKDQTVSALECLDIKTGMSITIKAKQYVLAAGAIESPRILLNSRIQVNENVGAFLQDGAKKVVAASLIPLWNSTDFLTSGYGDHISVVGNLPLPTGEKFNFIGSCYYSRLQIPNYLQALRFYPRVIKKYLAKKIYKSTVAVIFFAPSFPKRENRVVLSAVTDSFGVPKVEIIFQQPSVELEYQKQLAHFGKKLLRKAGGIGLQEFTEPPGAAIHYSGTCRMGNNPNTGVVDHNLQVFGFKNLYVCDGSVIPRLPEKQLSLTIMALAHRLGKHLIRSV